MTFLKTTEYLQLFQGFLKFHQHLSMDFAEIFLVLEKIFSLDFRPEVLEELVLKEDQREHLELVFIILKTDLNNFRSL